MRVKSGGVNFELWLVHDGRNGGDRLMTRLKPLIIIRLNLHRLHARIYDGCIMATRVSLGNCVHGSRCK